MKTILLTCFWGLRLILGLLLSFGMVVDFFFGPQGYEDYARFRAMAFLVGMLLIYSAMLEYKFLELKERLPPKVSKNG
jgi:hypothetical protein